jgi:hypothetical protein
MSLPIYQRVAVTDAGDVIPGAEYTVINENTGVAAPIYSDRTGATLLTAPYFANSVGVIQFYIAQGTTFRVAASGGVGTYTDRYVYGVAEAVLVNPNGNVGIGSGATTPATPLDVTAPGGGNFVANFQNTTAGTPYGVQVKDAASGANGYPLFQVTNSAATVGHFKVMSGTGNVGVGTNSPSFPFDCTKAAGGNFIANFQNTTAGTPYGVSIKDAAGGANGYPLFQVTNSAGSTAHLKVVSGTGDVLAAGNLFVGASVYQGSITSNASSFNILPSGFVSANVNNDYGMQVNRTGTDGKLFNFRKNGTDVGSISVSGSGISISYTSDQRLKENIENSDDSGSTVDSINVRQYDWKINGRHEKYSLIAQELKEVIPDVVIAGETPEAMMGIDYAKLVPLLIKEVQTLRARVTLLESN